MFRPKAQPSRYDTHSVAGKVFLLGEYAVLGGTPSLVAAIGPRFGLSSKVDVSRVHPNSPAGRLIASHEIQLRDTGGWSYCFHDPYEGRGGFGASSAQFALFYFVMAQRLGWSCSWQAAWKKFRDLTDESFIPPSGADLVAQWQGGIVFFDPSGPHCVDVWSLFDWNCLLVFSATQQASRKVKTHDHLNDLFKKGLLSERKSRLFSDLEKPLHQGMEAIRERRVVDFGRALDEYAEILKRAGLEASSTSEDRIFLRALPGVLGVKGTGAMQADGVVVLLDPADSGARERVITNAVNRKLRLISDGLDRQSGVTCQKSGF